jgi:hypothetical protein
MGKKLGKIKRRKRNVSRSEIETLIEFDGFRDDLYGGLSAVSHVECMRHRASCSGGGELLSLPTRPPENGSWTS